MVTMKQLGNETFTHKIPVVGRRTGNTTNTYNWDLIFNGTPWLLTRGEDFTVKVPTLVQAARKAARDRGILPQYIIAPDATNRDRAIIIGPRTTQKPATTHQDEEADDS
jgi:hypothetical protein